MLDRRRASEDHCAEPALDGVSQFAVEVVARLVAREGRTDPGRADTALREGFLDKFTAAVRSGDPMAFDALKPDIRRARITNAMLADCYIPEAARRLGVAWEEDRLSFAEVTIGTARLQAILREVSVDWSADDRSATRGATLLMVLPAGEQHTLGALVATSQLRRMGISVCLRIAPTDVELAGLLQDRRFDGAMVSAGGQVKLDAARKTVKLLKSLSHDRLRVAVGGAVMQKEMNVAERTGADIATNDIDVALAALGVATAAPDAGERA